MILYKFLFSQISQMHLLLKSNFKNFEPRNNFKRETMKNKDKLKNCLLVYTVHIGILIWHILHSEEQYDAI